MLSIKNQKAFTLIEISIVMLVIALIMGGIFVGKDIMRSYKLRMVISEVEHYKTIANIFMDRFDALPGDMGDAFAYWDTNCAADAVSCNGNNNNAIDSTQEELMYWRQLFLSEIIEKPYTGTLNGGNIVSGVNIPSSKMAKGSGHWINHNTIFGRTANYITFGADEGSSVHEGAIINPAEAYNIDENTDDGKADSGNTMAATATGMGATPCVTSATSPSDFVYDREENVCILHFNLGI